MKLSRKQAVMLILLLVFAVYGWSLGNDFQMGDDEEQILDNPLVWDWRNIPRLFGGSTYFRAESGEGYGLFYRPLMLSVYALIYSLFGARAIWFHLVQVVGHVLNTVLVFVLFERVMGVVDADLRPVRMREGGKAKILNLPFGSKSLVASKGGELGRVGWGRWVALWGAVIFGVHSGVSEAVFSIAALQEVMMMGLGLTGILLVDDYRSDKKLSWLMVEMGVMLLALLAKESGIVLVLMALVYAWFWRREAVRGVLLTVVLSLGLYIFLRLGVAGIGWGTGAVGLMTESSIGERLVTLPKILWLYARLFVYPKMLVIHQQWQVSEVTVGDFWIPLVGMLGVLGILGYLGVRGWWEDREGGKVYWFFLIWTGLGLGVHSQIIPLYETVAERWLYLPLVGMVGMAATLLKCKMQNSKCKMTMKNVKTLVLVGCLVVVGLGARTVIRGREWKDSGTLILGDVNKLPDDYFLDNLAGSWYIRQEEYEKAKPYLTESVGVRAFFGNVTNLATVYMREGELMKAEDMFFWAGELGRNYRTRQNLANFLTYIKKDYEQARRVSTEGLKDYPYAGEMWLTLAVAEYEVGEIAVASEAAYRAYQLTPMGLSEAVWEQVRAGEELQLDEWLR